MMTAKNVTYPSLLTLHECETIATDMFRREKTEVSGDAYWTQRQQIIKNSFGVYNLPSACVYADRFVARCARDYGPLRFVNNYTRTYRQGSFLQCHADRPDCDVTLSVCVLSTVKPDWPLVISNVFHAPPWDIEQHPPQAYFAADATAYVIDIGAGVACLGSRFPHWREPLPGDEHSIVMQAFYHMSFVP